MKSASPVNKFQPLEKGKKYKFTTLKEYSFIGTTTNIEVVGTCLEEDVEPEPDSDSDSERVFPLYKFKIEQLTPDTLGGCKELIETSHIIFNSMMKRFTTPDNKRFVFDYRIKFGCSIIS